MNAGVCLAVCVHVAKSTNVWTAANALSTTPHPPLLRPQELQQSGVLRLTEVPLSELRAELERDLSPQEVGARWAGRGEAAPHAVRKATNWPHLTGMLRYGPCGPCLAPL